MSAPVFCPVTSVQFGDTSGYTILLSIVQQPLVIKFKCFNELHSFHPSSCQISISKGHLLMRLIHSRVFFLIVSMCSLSDRGVDISIKLFGLFTMPFRLHAIGRVR